MVSTALVFVLATILTLSLASIAAEAAISTVISAIELSVAVTSNVYVVPLPAKLEAVPPATTRSPITKPVTASVKVTV